MTKYNLLTTNLKLQKNSGYKIMGLNLAPHTLSGYNVCPHAGACSTICIGEHSGFMKMKNVRAAQIRRTKQFFESRAQFLKDLHEDLEKFDKLVKKSAIRLNIDSDIVWEKVDKTLFDYDHIFYDYTKNPRRMINYMEGKLPSNYHLTFSYSERASPLFVGEILDNSFNVSVVFSAHHNNRNQSKLPKSHTFGPTTYKVIDGDKYDLRIPQKDGSGLIIGLRAKMAKSKIPHYQKIGFVI